MSKMESSTPKQSDLKLSDVARHVIYPKGITSSVWPRVVAQCAAMDVRFDSWQHGAGTLALGKLKNGKYAATVGGVVLSIPRQVGKTFLVGMMIIALCILFPKLTVLWTAHRTRTSTMTFKTMQAMVRKKKIRVHLSVPEVRQQRLVLAKLLATLDIPAPAEDHLPASSGVRSLRAV